MAAQLNAKLRIDGLVLV